MDTLIELALLAAAIYGIKSYFSRPGVIKNTEIFSSRGATFVKRLVSGQTEHCQEIKTELPLQSRQESLTDNRSDSVAQALESTETVNPPVNTVLDIVEQQPERLSVIVPEDSILKRHYLAHLEAEQAALKNPYPTDSVLRRHCEQKQFAALNLVIHDATAEGEEGASLNWTVNQTASETDAKQTVIPEDSVLKRHFLSQVQNEITKQCQPCPTDAVLKRHYQQLLQSRIDTYLAEFAK